MKRKMPPQKPGQSEQGYETPWPFIRAVEEFYGVKMAIDLAATEGTHKAKRYITAEEDSLSVNWSRRCGAAMWLNPPFGEISKWAAKCALEADRFRSANQKIFFLTPASVGTEWFAKSVWPKAKVYALRGRLTFVGETSPYIKDCMLSVFGGTNRQFDVWDWRRYTWRRYT